MRGRHVGARAVAAAEHMRIEFVRKLKVGAARVKLDTVSIPEEDGWVNELHLTLESPGHPAIVEAIDANLLTVEWANLILANNPVPVRAVVGISAKRTSCECGGNLAWFAQTTLYGYPAGEISLGCCCHTPTTALVQRLTDNVWNRHG